MSFTIYHIKWNARDKEKKTLSIYYFRDASRRTFTLVRFHADQFQTDFENSQRYIRGIFEDHLWYFYVRCSSSGSSSPSKYLVSWREGAVARASSVPRWWNVTMFGWWSRGGPLNSVVVVSITAMVAVASAPGPVAAPASAQPRSLHANT